MDTGVLILRLTLGISIALHGYSKFFQGGIPGTAAFFESLGIRHARFNAAVAATTELLGGVFLAIGLLTPLAAAGLIAVMCVAMWTAHRHNGFFITKGGWEYDLTIAVAALAVATIGAGTFSLDFALLRHSALAPILSGWAGLSIALVLGVVGSGLQLVTFYRSPAHSERPA